MDCATGIEARLRSPPDCYSMYMPLGGSLEVRCRGLDLVSRPGTILVGELQQTEFVRKHDARSHIALTFCRSEIRRELHEMLDAPVSRDIALAMEIPDTTAIYERLTAMGTFLWKSLATTSPDAIPLHSSERLFRAILVSLLEDLPHRYSEALARPTAVAVPWQVKRAIDYMAANVGYPLQTRQIAEAAGVSTRALQIAFQRFKDTTPLAYLRDLRLESARQRLRTGQASTVADVAKECGFAHMGRFSELYKAAFGELPSETRRNRSIY